MIAILDKSLISALLEDALVTCGVSVLKVGRVSFSREEEISFVDEDQCASQRANGLVPNIYMVSESVLPFVYKYLPQRPLEITRTFKNKHEFRKATSLLYPSFHFKSIKLSDAGPVQTDDLRFPLIIKPSIGFASVGISTIKNTEELKSTLVKLKKECGHLQVTYQEHVVSLDEFLIEDYIAGDEYAVDAYFDSDGNPIILNILKHPFTNDGDVGDRVYFTSKNIIADCHEPVLRELKAVGEIFNLKKYQMHIEFRVQNGRFIPIEINPLRFTGLCSTDIAYYAYGINTHEYFFKELKPDWEKILKSCDERYYCISCGDIPHSVDLRTIKNVRYDAFIKLFSTVFELRKFDHRSIHIFAEAFTATNDYGEIERFLKMDLSNYVVV